MPPARICDIDTDMSLARCFRGMACIRRKGDVNSYSALWFQVLDPTNGRDLKVTG